MKAVLCTAFGPPETLTVDEIDSEPLGENDVRVQVHACGVNFPDTLIIEGKYQFKPDFPFSPGSEAAGEIIEVGAAVGHLKSGDRVVRFGIFGAFREELVVPAAEVVPIPKQMSFEHAAAFMMTYGTSYHALVDRGHLQKDETLLVLGAGGGVGLAAVELGAAMGARVIAAASSDAKLEVARAKGATDVINYVTEDFRDRVKELTEGLGVDVLYDPVGGELAGLGLRSMAVGGRMLIVGFAAGDIPMFPGNLPLLKECQIVGVFFGNFRRREPQRAEQNLAQIMDWYTQGKVAPHVHESFPLERVNEAMATITEREVIGKVLLKTRFAV